MRLDPETGLYYDRARMYSSALGRFIQVDPVGYNSEQNLYTYVNNDPNDKTDPSGELGLGVSAGSAVEVGDYYQGAAAQFNVAAAVFVDTDALMSHGELKVSVATFVTAGAFARWNSHVAATSSKGPDKSPRVAGAFAGAGVNGIATNGNNVEDVKKEFKTTSVNGGWGRRVGSAQLATGQNAKGQPIAVASSSYVPGAGSLPGVGYGGDASHYNTYTTKETSTTWTFHPGEWLKHLVP